MDIKLIKHFKKLPNAHEGADSKKRHLFFTTKSMKDLKIPCFHFY